jgi:hypothetical protein
MYAWAVKKMISSNMRALNAGDVEPTLRLESRNIKLTFPGENSWSAGASNKAEHREWLERFARVGLQIFCDEVAASGWPWSIRASVRGHDYLDSPEGERVYENRYVIWARIVWGRVREVEVYEDTHKAQALDDWLAINESRLGADGTARGRGLGGRRRAKQAAATG